MMRRVLERLADWVDADAALGRRGRYLSTTFLVEVGDIAWLVTVHEGRLARVERGPVLMREWTFAIRASAEAWRRYWEPAGRRRLPGSRRRDRHVDLPALPAHR
jgi:hypothetical protein